MLDIEERLTLDERSAVDFVLGLRKRWADTVYPALREEYGATGAAATTVGDASQVLRGLPLYPWFSHLERVQQKMLWKVAGDAVLSRREELTDQLTSVPEQPKGSLELNPDLELPDWYTDYDIHIQPGSFFSDDMSAYVYEFGARIVMLRDNDGYKFHTLFAKTALPELPAATRIVDIGCGFGKSTRPLPAKYPTAQVIGVDLAAPGLRLAHAEAEATGLAIDYRQADGRATGIESGSCDVVTGTMVLHEMPATAIRETIVEAARLLKPGGSLRFLEFMLTGDPLRDATVYEHAERNNEPFFHDLFGSDLIEVCAEAGLTDVSWTPFDERRNGVQPQGWGDRPEWHFPWAVLAATKPEA
ncbi:MULTISPECIES: class I SAM-dependent methyltransferase [Micromonospora]|uniref:Class I SAM-dependent methyltransferase n=1 Tax=Micromonospora chalcea TaxID=1874 RepID=A0ABX9Y6V8_MICCH|nr:MULTISPECIES: class I SAM-dependent methyltransferase [Micromonospora]MBC8991382.1 methyltransferase domain-containing protein [Micromonospora chalcea]MBP1784053.1 ubiquinone/menaquinone biosynthesis C-methylase UbiE [Micromonospora sp. HB375]MBQ1059350.1 methyltransferase domain-containing protein [Micromonospora sp. C41]MBQ1066374.1 methyltransferase domain-containing protein [Micromonospora sp. D75]MDH6467045.1 ubiquinone/menaquinone biosynthesis C-methylase UbiE [Micromonospora sp. H404